MVTSEWQWAQQTSEVQYTKVCKCAPQNVNGPLRMSMGPSECQWAPQTSECQWAPQNANGPIRQVKYSLLQYVNGPLRMSMSPSECQWAPQNVNGPLRQVNVNGPLRMSQRPLALRSTV